MVSDGSGGAIVVWRDNRNSSTTGLDIYAQRLDANGNVKWQTDGVTVCAAAYTQDNPQLASDGAGGAIVTWHDDRTWATYDIFAQRVFSNGTVAWTSTYPITSGIPICADSGDQLYPQITSDGSWGAIIAYQDDFAGNWDIWAQKVDATGTVDLWAYCGRSLCSDLADQEHPQIAPDGAGGAIVTWEDIRNSGTTGWDIYAQRVQSNGNTAWTSNGVGLCVHSSGQEYPRIASDGSGGAVVAWQDQRPGSPSDIYAQRVDSSGNIKWGSGGLKVCGATDDQLHPQIASSGLGGAIIGWKDKRNHDNSGLDIYAQRMVDPDNDLSLPLVVRKYQ